MLWLTAILRIDIVIFAAVGFAASDTRFTTSFHAGFSPTGRKVGVVSAPASPVFVISNKTFKYINTGALFVFVARLLRI